MYKIILKIRYFRYLNNILKSHIKLIKTINKIVEDETLPLQDRKNILNEATKINKKIYVLYIEAKEFCCKSL